MKNNYQILLLLALNTGLNVCLMGQAQVPEPIHVFTDQEFYLKGEQICYSVFITAPTSHVNSNIVHVWLLNGEGEAMDHHALKLEDRHAHGQFLLPFDGGAETYTILAYTRWNWNVDNSYIFKKYIPIFSTEAEVDDEELSDMLATHLSVGTNNPSSVPAQNESRVLTFSPTSSVYAPGEIISLRFKLNGALESSNIGAYSVSVVKDTTALLLKSKEAPEMIGQTNGTFPDKSELIFPAEQVLSLTGIVNVNPEEEAFLPSMVRAYFPHLRSSISVPLNADRWEIKEVAFEGVKEVQFFEANPLGNKAIAVEVDKDTLPAAISRQKLSQLSYVSSMQRVSDSMSFLKSWIKEIERRRNFLLVARLFGESNKGKGDQVKEAPGEIDPIIPDVSFLRSDYIPFEDLEAFIEEVSVIKLVENDRGEDIRIFSRSQNRFFSQTPLILINGYASTNPEDFLRIEWMDIDRIDIFTQPEILRERFGTLGFHGVISVELTFNVLPEAVLSENNLETLVGLRSSSSAEFTGSETRSTAKTHAPNFKSTISWIPRGGVEKDQTASFRFRHSDERGRFNVKVEGITNDGQWFQASCFYEVKPSRKAK